MKIYGQLEKAGLEQIAASTTTPAWPGRVYMDITNAAKAIPRVYNGTQWLQLLTGTSSVVSQTSSGATGAVTVDWSQGTIQQVILGANTVISFTNPQAGQVHTLIVTQGASSGITPYYMFSLNMTDQDSRGGWYQPKGMPKVNESFVYSWYYSTGVKPGYATVPAIAWSPISTPGGTCYGLDISPDTKTLGIGTATNSPFNYYYNLFDVGGRPSFGQKNLVTPGTGLGTEFGLCYSPDGNFVFLVGNTSPYIQGFFLDRNHGVGSAITVPGTPPAGAANAVAMHPSGMFVGVAHQTTPFFTVYSLLGTGGGTITAPVYTKLTNAVTLPTNQATGICFSPTGDFITVTSLSSPWLQTWAFTNYTGNGVVTAGAIGAIVTNPSIVPVGGGNVGAPMQVAWRPQADYIAFAQSSSPYLYVVPFNRASAAYGTPLTINATTSALNGQGTGVAWTPDGQYLIVSQISSPWVNVFDFSAGTIGAPVAYDSTPFSAQINAMIASPDGNSLYCSTAAGSVIGLYLPNKQRNYMRLNY